MAASALSITNRPPENSNRFVQGVQTGIAATVNIVTTSEGMSKVSQLALDIFAMIEHAGRALAEGAVTLGVFLGAVVDITSIISVLKRIRDWTCPDENGKMLWEKAWEHIASMVAITGFHLLSFVNILATSLKVIAINAVLIPLSAVRFSLLAAYSVFDFLYSMNKIKDNKVKLEHLEHAKSVWEQRAKEMDENPFNVLPTTWTQLVTKQQGNWSAPTEEKRTIAVAKKAMWDGLAKVDDPAKIKEFCSKKVERLTMDIENHKTANTKSWVNIAFDIALVALAIFAVVASFVTPVGMAMTILLVISIVTGVLDVTTSYLDEVLKSKTLPTVEVPI